MSAVKFFSSPYPIKETWLSIYSNSDQNLTPFQSYESNVWISRKFYTKPSRLSYKRIYVCAEHDACRAILPLCVRPGHKDILFISAKTSLDFNDIIMDYYDEELISAIFDAISKRFPAYSFYLDKLKEDSSLFRYLSKRYTPKPADLCGRINFSSYSYEDYYLSLSKHQRQNLRTAYNKIEKESVTIALDRYVDVPDALYKKCQRMYEARMLNRGSFKSRFDMLKTRFMNPVNYILRTEPERTIFVLTLDGEAAGYIGGFYSKDHSVFYVPRLAGSMEYLRLSPGILLVNEVSKLLISEGTRCLDLTRGEEAYKFMMGAEKYELFRFDFAYEADKIVSK